MVGKTDIERRVAINSIGPFWDGNEVWLIVAGAGMFAAFPAWYASMFSALYLALMLIILSPYRPGRVLRVPGQGHRARGGGPPGTGASPSAAPSCRCCSASALGDLLNGLPINQNGDFTGSFLDLLTPYGLWVGVTLLALTLAHGAMYLSLKTTGSVQARAQRLAGPFSWIAVLASSWASPSGPTSSPSRACCPSPSQVLAFLLVVAAAWSVRDGHPGWGFAATTAAIAATVVSLFVSPVSQCDGLQHQQGLQPDRGQRASSHYALAR